MRSLFDQRSNSAASWRGSAAGAIRSHPLRHRRNVPPTGTFLFLFRGEVSASKVRVEDGTNLENTVLSGRIGRTDR